MKSQLIKKVNAAGNIHLSKNLVISLLQELVIAAQAVTVNVHHPDYMKKEEIVALYEKITGDKISKTFVKSHKREVFIDLAADTVAEELASYTDEMVEPELNKPEEVNEMNNLETQEEGIQRVKEEFIAELGKAGVDVKVVDIPIIGKEMGDSGYPTPVGSLSTSDYLPLYNKEENCDIEPKDDVDNSLPELPVLSEDQARTLMTKLIRHASNNKVKAFVHKQIVNSVIVKELTGKSLAGRKLSEFPEQEIHKAAEIKHLLVQAGLVPYKSGFMIKPFCMAGAYKNSVITYRAKNNTLYAINTCNKTITNMATGEMVDATKKNCAYLNKAQLVGITAA